MTRRGRWSGRVAGMLMALAISWFFGKPLLDALRHLPVPGADTVEAPAPPPVKRQP